MLNMGRKLFQNDQFTFQTILEEQFDDTKCLFSYYTFAIWCNNV